MARDRVIASFEAFLSDQITAFDFDDQLQEIETKDETVRLVIDEAWLHYDDVTDHQVQMDKQEWDLFQRLLLLLRSDAELATTPRRVWRSDHAVALTAVGCFLFCAAFVGWNGWLWLLAVPCGALSMMLSRWRDQHQPVTPPRELASLPFESSAEIRRVLRLTPALPQATVSDRTGWSGNAAADRAGIQPAAAVHQLVAAGALDAGVTGTSHGPAATDPDSVSIISNPTTMNWLRLTLLSILITTGLPAAEGGKEVSVIHLTNATLTQALDIYQALTDKEQVIDSRAKNVKHQISIRIIGEVTKVEAARQFRDALREQAGIVLTELDDKRVSVTHNDALPVKKAGVVPTQSGRQN